MAKTLSNTGIAKDQLILSSHVSQSVDAFTGADAYDIVISGSVGLTGSLIQRIGNVRFLDFTQVSKPHVVAYDVASGTLNYIPTASLVDSALTGSSMVTASVVSNTITFTQGDGSTFDIVVDTGSSGGTIDTGSLLETASVSLNTITFTQGDGSTFPITVDTGSTTAVDTGSLLETASVSLNTITFTQGDGSTFPITVDTGSTTAVDTGSLLETASATLNTITFTQGDGSTFDVLVDTGSGGGTTNTGSLLETASVSLNTITFTQGDGSTFPITVDTGSDDDWYDGGTFITSSKDVRITGSLTVSGSSTFTNVGPAVFEGNVTSSGNISSSGYVSASVLNIDNAISPNNDNTIKLSESVFRVENHNTAVGGDTPYAQFNADGGSDRVDFKLYGPQPRIELDISGSGFGNQLKFMRNGVLRAFKQLDSSDLVQNVGSYNFINAVGITTNIYLNGGGVFEINMPTTASQEISSSAAISASFFVGDGSKLTNIPETPPEWFNGGTFITSSKDVRITGSLLISGSTVIQGSGSDILTIQNLIGENILTVGESDAGYLSEVQNSGGETLLGVSATETFITNSLRLEGNQTTSGSLTLSGSTHQILGTTIISQGQLDVRSNIINLGNAPFDEIIMSGSVEVTSSNVNIDSSNIQLPSIPSNTSGQVLFYDTTTKKIAYGNTSSIAGGGGSDVWFDGTTYITSSVETRITGALKVNAGDLIDPDPTFILTADTGSSVAGPVIDLIRRPGLETGANGNYLGQIKFKGDSNTGVERVYAKVTGKIGDATNGSEDGLIEFMTLNNGSNKISARLTHTDLKLINGTGIEADGASLFENTVTISGSVLNTGSSFESTVDSFTVSKGDGVNMFVVNETGSKVASGSRIFSSTSVPNVGTTARVLNVDSNCIYFARQGTASSMGKMVLPTGLTSNEDGLTFEIFYIQDATVPAGSVFEISASDGTGILANTNLVNGAAVKLKCIYSNTFNSLNLGTGTGWLITEDSVTF